MTKKTSFFNSIILFINVIAVFLLLATYLCGKLDPLVFKYLSLLSLTYPYLLCINVLFVIYWFFTKRRMMFISLFTIIIGLGSLFKWVQFSSKEKSEENDDLKLLSYNVHVMGVDNNSIERRDSIVSFLGNQQAGVMCLQEFYDRNNKNTNKIKQTTGATYVYKSDAVVDNGHTYGLVTLSHYPIINKGSVIFPNSKGNHATFSDIVFADDTLRIYNIHLQSMHFANDALKINGVNFSKESVKEESQKVIRKIINGSMKRSWQVRLLLEHIAQSPYKIIICGDFNDTPWSFAYQQLKKDRKDAFVESGKGFSNTFAINKFIAFRIDAILMDKTLKSYNYNYSDTKFSDHECIWTTIDL